MRPIRGRGREEGWRSVAAIAAWVLSGACGADVVASTDAVDSATANDSAAVDSATASDSVLADSASDTTVAIPPDERYDVGEPVLLDRWVDPVAGSDDHDGATRATAMRTLTHAWRSLPAALTEGVRIWLTPGVYDGAYLESKRGTHAAPIVITASDGRASVTIGEGGGIGGLTFYNSAYVYLIDVTVASPSDPFHLDHCDHVLLRGVEVRGTRGGGQTEAVKVNQSQHIYIEDSDVHGAGDNAIDFVAVQYGHIVGSRIHDANDWCAYTKGGSAYIRVADNEIYDCGTGGFAAGQGTGFQFMVAPWIHYEAYGIEVVNNVIRDTWGACLGVMGGYDILFAHNTCYRVGTRSHVLEVGLGGRGCDGHDVAACRPSLDAGGWGVLGDGGDFIPSRHVWLLANLVYNPPGVHAAWQHLSVGGPAAAPAESHLVGLQSADDDLRLRGNLVWNGPPEVPEMSLGVSGEGGACTDANPTCNPTQLVADNALNRVTPRLVDPANGDFRPTRDPTWADVPIAALPPWDWSDRPTLSSGPQLPEGPTHRGAGRDRAGVLRGPDAPPGAYTFAPD